MIFDIETGPGAWDDISIFYEPPEPLPPWSEDMVAYGNLKDPIKRAEKRDAVYQAYQQKLAAEQDAIAQHKADWIKKAALSAHTGRVLAIGILPEKPLVEDAGGNADDAQITPIILTDTNEACLLEQWWSMVDKALMCDNELVIGFNIFEFDLPFLVQRSMINGVAIRPEIYDMSGRWHRNFHDVLKLYRCGTKQYISLDKLCAVCGGPRKPDGVDGSMFAELFYTDREKAMEYLLNDLRMTEFLVERFTR